MNRSRNFTSLVAWMSYLAVVVYLAGNLGPVAIPFAAIMMVPLIVLMNFLWKAGEQEERASMTNTEKRKRKRIDTMLRDMSDDELYELRQRLQDGSLDEDSLYDRVVGEDGELILR